MFDAALTCPEPWSHVNLTQFAFFWIFAARNGLILFDKNYLSRYLTRVIQSYITEDLINWSSITFVKVIAKSNNNLVIIGKITFLAFVTQLIQGEDLFYPAQQALLYSWRFFRTVRTMIGYFEITYHLTMKLFPAKFWAGNIYARSMTSDGNSAKGGRGRRYSEV